MSIAHAHHRGQVPFGFLFRGVAGFGIAGLVAVGVAVALLRTEAPDFVYLLAGILGGIAGGVIAYRVGRLSAKD